MHLPAKELSSHSFWALWFLNVVLQCTISPKDLTELISSCLATGYLRQSWNLIYSGSWGGRQRYYDAVLPNSMALWCYIECYQTQWSFFKEKLHNQCTETPWSVSWQFKYEFRMKIGHGGWCDPISLLSFYTVWTTASKAGLTWN